MLQAQPKIQRDMIAPRQVCGQIVSTEAGEKAGNFSHSHTVCGFLCNTLALLDGFGVITCHRRYVL
jgi:hypothetical protein